MNPVMEFKESRLKDPAFFRENRLPAHSDHMVFASREEAAAGTGSLRMSLNGWWKFFHALNPGQIIPGFEQPGYDCSAWADIAVPSHIQMEGYGHPQYCNIQYPWDGVEDIEAGQIPEGFNPVGCYVKNFYLPREWENHRVAVSFQGAESCVAVWLNGHYVGFAGDSFTPSEFELTPYLQPGKNKLACRVYRFSAGSWLEDQDYMRFSGLYRDVFLYMMPEVHMRDLKIRTELDDRYQDAVLVLEGDVEAEMEAGTKAGTKADTKADTKDGTKAGTKADTKAGTKRSAEADHPAVCIAEIRLTDGSEVTAGTVATLATTVIMTDAAAPDVTAGTVATLATTVTVTDAAMPDVTAGTSPETAVDETAPETAVDETVTETAAAGTTPETSPFRAAGRLSVRIPVPAPHKWSSEDPHLYDLEILLKNADGEQIECVREKVGFRRFEMKNGIMCLNGVRIVFKGVNRHDFCGETGRAVPPEKLRRDLLEMKRNNINAVRTCHYPDQLLLYRLCDELGIYLIAENNMETHDYWNRVAMGLLPLEKALPGDREEYLPLLLDRVDSTYHTVKNRPSVLIWSCGNESYGGTVILEMSRRFRELDSGRLVHYEGVFWDPRYPETTDMYTQMYPHPDKLREFVEEHRDKPHILCEYAHAMGNSCGALYKYTEYAYEEERYQGGFIWDYIDQAIRRKDRYGNAAYGYGGDFDDRPHDGEFSGDGIVFADGTPTPKMQEVKYCYQNIVATVTETEAVVENRSMFTSTDRYACVAVLCREGRELARAPMNVDVPPLSKAVFPLPFPKAALPGEYTVTLSFFLKERTEWAEAGYEAAFAQGVYKVSKADRADRAASAPDVPGESLRAPGESHCAPGESLRAPGESHCAPGESLRAPGESLRALRKDPPEPSGNPPEPSGNPPEPSRDPLKVVRGIHNLGVYGDGFSVMFSLEHGTLISYRHGAVEMLKTPPVPNFWRAPTNNDDGNGMPCRYAQWKIASLYLHPDTKKTWSPSSVGDDGDGGVTVTFPYVIPTTPEAACRVTYTVRPDGRIKVRLDMDPVPELGDMPEFGMLFKLDADYDRIRYYGRGPEENYIDRHAGARLGLFETTPRKNMTNYLVPQECGNRTGVRYADVLDAKGRGLRFEGDGMEFSALPYTPHEIENARHGYELPPAHYTVLRIAKQQMGVGGDNSWGARTHTEFLLDVSKQISFEFSFRGKLDRE